jgi:hypothetical protein
VAYPHQDQLRRVGRGDEDTAPGATHVGSVRYGDVDYYEDRRALDALIAAVPPEMQFSLFKKRTAKEVWDVIAAARISSDRARKTTLQALHKEWENLAFKPGEDVDDFALRFNTLLQKMVQIGDDTYDEESH